MRRWLRVLPVLLLLMVGACDCAQDDGPGGDAQDTGLTDSGDAGGLDAADTDRADTASGDTDTTDTRRPDPSDAGTEWDWGTPEDTGPAPFELTGVIPATGPVEGGNRVRLRGSGFDDDMQVWLGSREMPVELSGGELTGRAPAAAGPGPVTVKIIADDGQTRTIADGYAYVEGLRIDTVAPAQVPTDGGVEVEVRGRGFEPEAAVSFSGTAALRVTVVDSTLMRVVTPARSRGWADVRVTTPTASAVAARAVEYVEPLEIRAVKPAAGTTAGGQLVELEGRGFTSGMRVYFGGQPAVVDAVDVPANTAIVRTPGHAAGLVDVSAETTFRSAILTDGFLYRDDTSPKLAALSPDFGPTSGGTEVMLRGDGFDHPDLAITFGGQPATIVEADPTWALVTSPPGSVGAVDVAMGHGATEIDRLVDGFTYRADVWIDRIDPAEGPTDGGQIVRLTGEGFTGAERVAIGGLPAAFTVVSDTVIEATTPAHSAGPADVTVEREGLTGRLVDGYTYTEPLEVWGFTPVRGAIAGGTYVEVRGRGFWGDLSVRHDANQAPQLQRHDPNKQ